MAITVRQSLLQKQIGGMLYPVKHQSKYTPPPVLLASWNFDDLISGVTSADKSGNGHLLTFSAGADGKPLYTAPGKNGAAAAFTGLNYQVQSSASTGDNGGSWWDTTLDWSVAVWGLCVTDFGNEGRIGHQDCLSIRIRGDQFGIVDGFGNSRYFQTGVPDPTNKQWHHYGVVHDSVANTLKGYVDGVLVSTVTSADSLFLPWRNSQPFILNYSPGFDAVNDTEFDDLRIYASTLTQAQIATLMTTPVS